MNEYDEGRHGHVRDQVGFTAAQVRLLPTRCSPGCGDFARTRLVEADMEQEAVSEGQGLGNKAIFFGGLGPQEGIGMDESAPEGAHSTPERPYFMSFDTRQSAGCGVDGHRRIARRVTRRFMGTGLDKHRLGRTGQRTCGGA